MRSRSSVCVIGVVLALAPPLLSYPASAGGAAVAARPGSPTFRVVAVSVACPESRTTTISVSRIRAVGYRPNVGQPAQIRYRLLAGRRSTRWNSAADTMGTVNGFFGGIRRGSVAVQARVRNDAGWGRWSRVRTVRIKPGSSDLYCGS